MGAQLVVFFYTLLNIQTIQTDREALSVHTCGCVCTYNTVVQVYTVTCHVVSVVYVEGGLGMVMYRVA